MVHAIKKLGGTLAICWRILMARTFGKYINSGWDGICEYAEYQWRGHRVRIPTFTEYRVVSEDELLAALAREYRK